MHALFCGSPILQRIENEIGIVDIALQCCVDPIAMQSIHGLKMQRRRHQPVNELGPLAATLTRHTSTCGVDTLHLGLVEIATDESSQAVLLVQADVPGVNSLSVLHFRGLGKWWRRSSCDLNVVR